MTASFSTGALGSSGSVQALDDFDGWVHHQLHSVEAALSQWVPQGAPAGLGEALLRASERQHHDDGSE